MGVGHIANLTIFSFLTIPRACRHYRFSVKTLPKCVNKHIGVRYGKTIPSFRSKTAKFALTDKNVSKL